MYPTELAQGPDKFRRRRHLPAFIAVIAASLLAAACGHPDTALPPLPPAGTESWYGAYLGGQQVGFMRQRTSRTAGGGIAIFTENFISAKSLDRPISMRMIESLEATSDFRPVKYYQTVDAGLTDPYRVLGEQTNANTFVLKVESAGRVIKEKTISMDDMMFPQLADQRIRAESLEVGKTWTFRVLNPVDFLPIRIRVSVDGRTRLSTAGVDRDVFVVTAKIGAVEIVSYVDTALADPVRIEMRGLGLEYRLEDKSAAERVSADDPADLDLAHFSAVVPAGGVFPPDSAGRVRMRLSRIMPDDLDIAGDYQVIVKSSDSVAVIDVITPDPDLLNARPADTGAMQAGSAQVSGKIRRIASTFSRESPGAFARDASTWMLHNIRQIPTSIVPTADDVLEIKQGDCNEFSALFHALAGAAGFPCKIVSGVLYMDGKFYYHSWNEILAGKRWIPVDAILNERPASFRHIKLIEGDFSAAWKLAGVIRVLQIEILSGASG